MDGFACCAVQLEQGIACFEESVDGADTVRVVGYSIVFAFL